MKTFRKILFWFATASFGYLIAIGIFNLYPPNKKLIDFDTWTIGLAFGFFSALMLRREFAVLYKKPYTNVTRVIVNNRFYITGSNFKDLIEGEVTEIGVAPERIKLILADLGYDEMLNIIQQAKQKSHE